MDLRTYFLPFVVAGLMGLSIAAAAPSFAEDRCAQLVALSHEYAGVQLTAYQRQIKRRMVVWYDRHCRRR